MGRAGEYAGGDGVGGAKRDTAATAGRDGRRSAGDAAIAGLVAPGEFQFNVVLPAGLTDGDQPVSVSYGGAKTQSGTLIAVKH